MVISSLFGAGAVAGVVCFFCAFSKKIKAVKNTKIAGRKIFINSINDSMQGVFVISNVLCNYLSIVLKELKFEFISHSFHFLPSFCGCVSYL